MTASVTDHPVNTSPAAPDLLPELAAILVMLGAYPQDAQWWGPRLGYPVSALEAALIAAGRLAMAQANLP